MSARTPDAVRSAIVSEYTAGRPLDDIARGAGVSVATVNNITRAAGLPKRPPRRGVPGVDLTGMRFGRLTVVRLGDTPGKLESLFWLCRCECGASVEVLGKNMRGGMTRSCGCLNRESRVATHTKHGDSPFKGASTAEYRSWKGAKERTRSRKPKYWPMYGARGLRVCARWADSYAAFLADMGRKPFPRADLDRIDNGVGYTCGKCDDCRANGWPANCRWVDRRTNLLNRRSTIVVRYQGEDRPLSEWCRLLGLRYRVVAFRLKAGWDVERAFTTPARPEPATPAGQPKPSKS